VRSRRTGVEALTLYLDLGDAFTKALALDQRGERTFRFPSVIAHSLIQGGAEETSLLLDEASVVQRPLEFTLERRPRTDSFPRSERVTQFLRSHPPERGARFVGGLAAVYGADRRLFGLHPTVEHVDALVRKALLLASPVAASSATVVFIVDMGQKADAILRYLATLPRELTIEAHNFYRAGSRRIRTVLHGRCVDAMSCALAALPHEVSTTRTVIIDVGYLRSKFGVLSVAGCEHQEQVEGLGIADCIYRILRDGGEQGLIVDEYALMRALERSPPERLQVGGGQHDVRPLLSSARRAVAEEVLRAARRIALGQLTRSGQMCTAAAMIGGGGVVLGTELAWQLKHELDLRHVWVSGLRDDLLVQGARQLEAP
jgi:hypothetical protein